MFDRKVTLKTLTWNNHKSENVCAIYLVSVFFKSERRVIVSSYLCVMLLC